MPEALTPRQQQVLDLIAAHLAAEGRPPTLREIARALGLRQHSSAQTYVEALVRKGWLHRSSSHRGLRLALPTAPAGDAPAPRLPLIGRVAAGAPILAEAHVETRFAIDPALFRPRADYLLRVHGDSMTGAGILDRDLIAVHRTPEARDGQIVVARVEDEVTVKRLRRTAGRVELLPESPDHLPIVVDPERSAFAIEGLCVGVIRRG